MDLYGYGWCSLVGLLIDTYVYNIHVYKSPFELLKTRRELLIFSCTRWQKNTYNPRYNNYKNKTKYLDAFINNPIKYLKIIIIYLLLSNNTLIY